MVRCSDRCTEGGGSKPAVECAKFFSHPREKNRTIIKFKYEDQAQLIDKYYDRMRAHT